MENKLAVGIIAPAGATLGVVLQAALTAKGWTTILTERLPDHDGAAPPDMPGSPILVIVEDDDGAVDTQVSGTFSLDNFICVGSINSIATLIPLAARGATVLNQAAPIIVLLELVQQALLASRPGSRAATEGSTEGTELTELLQRQLEAGRLARLSSAENDVLRGIVAGLNATQIAERSHHSVHTIRSQIKAILGKLEVRTQLSAVAITHRSAAHRWLYTGPARFTNFGDDPSLPPRQH
jgi:DNA-binding CsgD family transcriptional regulator